MRRLAIILALVPACSAIGDPGSFPEAFPHGGTGQFRFLEEDEVGLRSPIQGRALAVSRTALDGAMVAEGHLFYTGARLMDAAMPPPEGFPENEVFWDAFEPRAIFRSDPREDRGFDAGEPIFEAEQAWEGGEVFDPWVVVDGAIYRLYYAAAGGIGVAESGAIDGPYERVLDAPIVEMARRPSVVRGPDGAWWMYYDGGESIVAARSEDGVEFASMGAIDPFLAEANVVAEANAIESPEAFVGHPGAVGLATTTGRRLVRMYFSSWREDGSVVLLVAGSADGVTFERHPLPVVESPDARFAAPVLLDDRVTLLYFNVPFVSTAQVRTLVASVSPAAVSFLPPEE